MAISHGVTDPASRFRIVQYLPRFANAGWEVTHRPKRPRKWEPQTPAGRFLRTLSSPFGKWQRARNRAADIRDAAGCELVFQNRDLLGGNLKWEQALFKANPRVIYDFDDAIFLGPKRERHTAWVCRQAAWVTVGNEYLARFARQYTDRVSIVPTAVDVSTYHIKDYNAPPPETLRIGWMGSGHSIRETLFPLIETLAAIQRDIPFDFVIISSPPPPLPESSLRWKFVEWTPAVEMSVASFIDIGIMPLVDNDFQRGKCGLKLLQYMAAGLPVIASPVGVNSDLTRDSGLLASTPAEWKLAVEHFVTQPNSMKLLGLTGRHRCESDFSLDRWSRHLLQLFDATALNRPPTP